MPHLSWNEVRDRAIRFSRDHAGDRSESAQKQTFWNEFFEVFDLRRASLAETQAFTYIEDLTRENRWDEIPSFGL